MSESIAQPGLNSLSKSFEPAALEAHWGPEWEKRGYGAAGVRGTGKPDASQPAFAIQLPPPNVTGTLHMGHAFNQTIMDSLTRYHRMKGYNTAWIPGTDHAGIATQIVVERQLQTQGVSRYDLGRDEFVKKIWEWKEKSGNTITTQMRRMGDTVDWSREYFTMDDKLSKVVTETFVRLYQQGLIYRGKRLVNWDPVLQSAVSDLEVESQEKDGSLWHIAYPLTDGSGQLVVATTRPETMLGDVAVMVHPEDERYKHLIGKTVTLPLVGREIPVIADEYVDKEFGTGVVKVTPAHDQNDYQVGLRHNLPMICVLDLTAKINHEAPEKYRGMDRFVARKAIVADLEELGLLVEIKKHKLMVPICDRTGQVIEPMLTDQWFMAMNKVGEGDATGKSIAQKAIDAVANGDVKFVPENWVNTYNQWMNNIQDWCISRQLWWGQRIPAYYLPKGGFVVALTTEEALEKARAKSGDASLQLTDLRQDEDVLDTWFSSWLWPISVFDGIRFPDNREIGYYYPTNDLVTGPDIIFFWVARMIMAGYEYRHEKPFSNVYFTGIVRDKIGRKMSKQLGNSPDPLDLIAQYGADGVRMAMLISSSAGNDVMFDEALCEQGRNFGNKIWNAYRLLNGWAVDAAAAQSENNRLAVAWFGQALGRSLRQIAEDFKSYRISEAFKEAYRLFWDDFSGLYLEMAKPAYGQPIDAPTMEATKGYFDALMRVLHPFMPFVTEEIWQDLAPRAEGASICVAQMPEPAAEDAAMLARFELAKEIITSVRNIRNQKSLPQKEALTLRVIADENYPAEFAPVVMKMANLTAIETVAEKDPAAAAFIVKTTQYFVPMAGKIDAEAERKKLADDLAYYEGFLASVMKKLSNERFVASAPEKVVANERAKQADAEAKITAIREQLAALESGK